MRISDWSSDVCSSDLRTRRVKLARKPFERRAAIDIARIAAARREAEVARKVDQKQQHPQAKHESPDRRDEVRQLEPLPRQIGIDAPRHALETDRKSTRLNSSH